MPNRDLYDVCPTCGGLKRTSSRFCINCSAEVRQKVQGQMTRVIQLAREQKQARVHQLIHQWWVSEAQ